MFFTLRVRYTVANVDYIFYTMMVLRRSRQKPTDGELYDIIILYFTRSSTIAYHERLLLLLLLSPLCLFYLFTRHNIRRSRIFMHISGTHVCTSGTAAAV